MIRPGSGDNETKTEVLLVLTLIGSYTVFFNSQDLDPTQFRRGVKLECVDFFRTSNLLDAPVPRQT